MDKDKEREEEKENQIQVALGKLLRKYTFRVRSCKCTCFILFR